MLGRQHEDLVDAAGLGHHVDGPEVADGQGGRRRRRRGRGSGSPASARRRSRRRSESGKRRLLVAGAEGAGAAGIGLDGLHPGSEVGGSLSTLGHDGDPSARQGVQAKLAHGSPRIRRPRRRCVLLRRGIGRVWPMSPGARPIMTRSCGDADRPSTLSVGTRSRDAHCGRRRGCDPSRPSVPPASDRLRRPPRPGRPGWRSGPATAQAHAPASVISMKWPSARRSSGWCTSTDSTTWWADIDRTPTVPPSGRSGSGTNASTTRWPPGASRSATPVRQRQRDAGSRAKSEL